MAGKNGVAAGANLCFTFPSLVQQDTTGSGVIVGLLLDTNEKPIIGAEVSVKDKASSVITDNMGVFKVNAAKDDVLVFKLGGNIIAQHTLKSDLTPTVVVSSKASGVNDRLSVNLLNNIKTDPWLTPHQQM
jgi:hypothetical protein